jgi:hypothetical protein
VLLIVPTPVTLRNVALCIATNDEVRSNVNPPTLHRADVAGPGIGIAGVPELKVQEGAIVALVN